MNLRSWREIKILLKRRFSILQDKDFNFKETQRELMLDQLCVKLNKSRSDLDLLFAKLQKL
jgi:hypothetical protein